MENKIKNHTKLWRGYASGVAYPTIILWAVVLSVNIASLYAGIMDILPLWLSGTINFVCIYLLFTPMHEAAHGNIKGSNRKLLMLENFIGWTSGMSAVFPVFPFIKWEHLKHHNHTNDPEKDPDYWVATTNYFLLIPKCFTIITSYMYQMFVKSMKELLSSPSNQKTLYWTLFGLILNLSLVVLWYYLQDFKHILYLFLIPTFTGYAFLALVFDWLPHVPHKSTKRYLDTRIIIGPGLNTVLLGQNYHLVHHLYPSIPYYNYQKAYGVLKEELEDNNANIIHN